MAEVYPSDAALNALLSEAETGVEYIPTGTTPYYLHFRKLLYRLLLATRRANDLRVFDEGGLNIGVKAGKFFNGSEYISYAGSTGNALFDNQATIYVYLDYAGNLVKNEYSAFPDPASVVHVRLAVVTTSGGDITSITDCRDYHSLSVNTSPVKRSVDDERFTVNITEAQSGTIFTNYGALEMAVYNLPDPASSGLIYTFSLAAAQAVHIDPGTAAIIDASGQTAGKYKYTNDVGASLSVASDDYGNWIVIGKAGVWYEEA